MLVLPCILPIQLNDVFSMVEAAVGCGIISSCVIRAGDGLPFGRTMLDIEYGEYPYWGFGIGYDPFNGHSKHERRHRYTCTGRHATCESRLAIWSPPRRKAVSCRRHVAYAYAKAYTYRMRRSD